MEPKRSSPSPFEQQGTIFNKVLVVEDLDTVGYGITMMLQQEMGVRDVAWTKYCDNAYLKVEQASRDGFPFELLITDLSFKQDHTPLQLSSGKELIQKIRGKGHTLPIIICSVEEKPAMIKRFVQENNVSAYVLKVRDGLKDLKNAVVSVSKGKAFFSERIKQLGKNQSVYEIEDYDINLLVYLSRGLSQNQIAHLFSSKGVSPSSLSSIEKRLNRLKDVLKANNNVQLVANAKDIGLI